jgi:predicted DCC family thiol-disulfide oxidoreductase YuxK
MWVGYGQSLTGDSVEYAPYQSAAARFPDVPREDFPKAVQYFSGAEHSRAAEAVFRLIAPVPGYAWPLWLYLHLPGFAALTEFLYAFVAAHRSAGYRVTRLLWGITVERPSYRMPHRPSRAPSL